MSIDYLGLAVLAMFLWLFYLGFTSWLRGRVPSFFHRRRIGVEAFQFLISFCCIALIFGFLIYRGVMPWPPTQIWRAVV